MRIEGKTICLHPVDVEDAAFILSLRMDDNLNKHLSSVQDDLGRQKEWIKQYKEREKKKTEFYFVISWKSGEKWGTVRLYDFRGDSSFRWGSWIIKKGASASLAIESALCVYEFAYGSLGFNKSYFEVRKANERVVAFHKRFGAVIVDEDKLNYYFQYTKEDYHRIRTKYKRYLHG